MIVEPAPTSPRSPGRRGLWLAGLVLPPTLLVLVVAAGVLGSQAEPQPTKPAPTAAALVAADPASPIPAAATPEPNEADEALDVEFPYAWEALAVTPPSALVIARAAGRSAGIAAVAGYLSVSTPNVVCVALAPEPPGPWCEREGIIAERSWSRSTGGSGGMPPHLHVKIPIGVGLPVEIERASRVGGGPIPVVAIGRFAPDAGPCRPGGPGCNHGFVIDRIGWSDGAVLRITPLLEPRRREEARRPDWRGRYEYWWTTAPFEAVVGDGDVPLLAVLALPDTIAVLDPATRSATTTVPDAHPVWYVRLAEGVRAANRWQPRGTPVVDPGVRWVLLDAAQPGVIATGKAGEAPGPVE